MQALIDIIQTAITDGATADQKAAGAQACRTLLVALESEPGTPLAAPVGASPASAPATPTPLDLLARLGPDQALDLILGKLRDAVPRDVREERARGFKVQLVGVPKIGGTR